MLKKYWLPAMVALLIALLGFQKCSIDKLKDTTQIQAVEISTLNDSVSVYRSKAGKLTYKLTSVEIEKDNLKRSLLIAGYDIRELKDRDLNWRKITSALKAELASTGSGSVVLKDTIYITNTDTIRAANFAWKNRYLSLTGKVTPKALDFKYVYRTAIDVVQSGDVISIYLSDPNAVITTGHQFAVTHKRRWYQKPWVWGAVGLVGGMLVK